MSETLQKEPVREQEKGDMTRKIKSYSIGKGIWYSKKNGLDNYIFIGLGTYIINRFRGFKEHKTETTRAEFK